LLSGGA
ncbi:unnamed protein product, partial [Allacma fusca]